MKKFSVDISGLKNKTHTFDFEVGKELFEAFENDVLNDISLQVLLTLQKTETMITATAALDGTVELVCDRSLRTFDHKVDLEETVYYKFGETYTELSDGVIIIPFNYGAINFAQLIYDTLILSIPPKVIHPDLQNEESEENEKLVFSTDENIVDTTEQKKEEEKTDPRWYKLKALKFNKN